MARIRTIKPDFFSSDDICALSPLARLLYIGLWCEADREGRLVWAPRVFKRRYLPDDDCDIEALCDELTNRTLVRRYGDGLACIPSFAKHQHVNPREAASILPEPDASPRVSDACARVSDAQVGKEREGKEGNGNDASRTRPQMAHALPDGWQPSEDDLAAVKKGRPDLTPAQITAETERFRNHAKANNRTAHNWGPNFRNWLSKATIAEPLKNGAANGTAALASSDDEATWRTRLKGWKPGKLWSPMWGPRPGDPGCFVPPAILAEWKATQVTA